MDFTLKTYNKLLTALNNQGFLFLTFRDFVSDGSGKQLVLRHDVDSLPENSLQFAKIQADKGIMGTYYFRSVTETWNEEIIRKIAEMGHEVGYHYEDLSFAWAKLKAQGFHLRSSSYGGQAGHHPSQGFGWQSRAQGEELKKMVVDIGIELFKENLDKLRKIAPVKTICMHGRPMSRWDSRLLWKYYDYHDFGIIGEPYFDIDFDEVLYLTDTGRRWDGDFVSIRDKAQSTELRAQGGNPYKDWKVKPIKYRPDVNKNNVSPSPPLPLSLSSYRFHSTFDIIKAAEENKLPDKIMMTFHPQRWTDKPLPWVKELVWQNVKNVGKYFLVKMRN